MNYRGPSLFRHEEVCTAGPSSSVNEVQDRNDVLPSSLKLILKSGRSIRKINPYNHTIPRKT